ncbi:MAG TPA: subclass B3 metallo-beta-lactamase, partial [Gemmatimonadaceae bacterium]|nr:subclass B3 metallo-beta-lactamase [Gemmatimonadaceae bacterium]
MLLVATLAIAVALFIPLFQKWKTSSDNGGQKPAEPFRIAGNLYYVGANDVTSFLITGPAGHVLIDGGYPGTAPMIMHSIAKLGFDIRDVKVLLNSHWHLDHAGGLAALQKASGAQLWVSEADAGTVARGGVGDPTLGPLGFIMYLPAFHYPAPHVDHRFTDGAKVRVGPIELTAHVTPGHTRGCTTWTFPVNDGTRELLAADVCGLELGLPVWLLERTYPEFKTDFEHTFATLRNLPVDIFLATHARHFGRWRKFQARATARNPVDPFIDRKGYLELIDRDERKFREQLG